MKLTFLGGADEVGASSTLIEIAGQRLLVDAGIRISGRPDRGIRADQLPDLHPVTAAGGPDFILVTHAHTDHTGALPLVVEQYPQAPVLATPPTIDLVRVLQADAQIIMQARQEAEGELPLFDALAVSRLLDAFQPVAFRQPVRLGEGLQVTYYPAGHIIGAASLVLESEEGTLVLSGDLSLNDQRAVVRAGLPRVKADALVLESTYGGRLHANRSAEEKRLIQTLARIVEGGGRALIPAFALGRAQEILQIILAYRDQFAAPVYADGMVRAVCRAYARLAEWLPAATVQAAGGDDLFFRDGLRPVLNAAQREEIARAGEPAVIVASSGMLTGGASVVYARHLAGDERSAILLTGYQDEEAPGRFLQRLARERAAGEPTLRLNKDVVTVRCAVDTYSLSAHADEAELVSAAESFDPADVFLVHGDPAARHSLATRLRERGRRVHLPIAGQEVALAYARRPWALGAAREQPAQAGRPFDEAALWEALKPQAGSYFSARELAQMWWGDAGRAEEIRAALAGSLYFAPDWRRRDTFSVRPPDQVERLRRCRAIMLRHPHLIGQVIVLRDGGRPRAGVVVGADIESFEAVVHGAKRRRYPADALLWAVGAYQGPPEGKGLEGRLAALVKAAAALQEALLPFDRRQALAGAGTPVDPANLTPPDTDDPLAARLAVTLALAGDGAAWTPDGLLPGGAQPSGEAGPLEQNQAREAALGLFPPEARLRRVGLEVGRRRLTLTFDFPARAAAQYADLIARTAELTGWEVVVNPAVNQQALAALVDESLPPGARIVKGPSFFLDRREAHVTVEGQGDWDAAAARFAEATGFTLAIRPAGEAAAPPAPASAPAGERMEINAAYAHLRAALEPYGLYRTSLKQDQIVLAFVSPQVGERHRDTIARLAAETGYPLTIHPHPNQQEILRLVSQAVRAAGWTVRKGPGIHIDRAEVSLSLAEPPAAADLEAVVQQVEAATGYRLVIT